MRHFRCADLRKKLFVCLMSSGLLFSCFSFVTIETETINANGKTLTVRASSKLEGGAMYGLRYMFDNDSTTCWIEGRADTRAGRWIDVSYPGKKRYRGLVLGLGCRKEHICMEEFCVPTKMSLKVDEKPAIDFTMDWDISRGEVSPEDINMRKAVVWFNSDTAFTTALFQLKFTGTFGGRKYANLAVSDFEPVEEYDARFTLLSILSAATFNPNDIGTINSPVLFNGDDEPRWINRVFQTVFQEKGPGDAVEDSARIEQGLNSASQAVTDNAEIVRLVGVLKKLLIKDNRAPRFLADGRSMTYLLFVGSLGVRDARWDIWRSITTAPTAKGLEVTIRYVPFYKPNSR